MGPVEYIVVEFPGNKFSGEIVPALVELTESGTIHVVDLIFVKKDADGSVTSLELSSLDPAEAAAFDELDGEVSGMLSEEDIMFAAGMLEPDSSAAVLVYESLWAVRLRDAIVNAHGRLVDSGRIPVAAVEMAEAALAE